MKTVTMKSLLALLLTLSIVLSASAAEPFSNAGATFIDLSLLVSPELPCTWPAPGFAPFHINHYRQIGRTSEYNCDILAIDGNTGTQMDVPPHSIPLPDSKLPNAGPWGEMF